MDVVFTSQEAPWSQPDDDCVYRFQHRSSLRATDFLRWRDQGNQRRIPERADWPD